MKLKNNKQNVKRIDKFCIFVLMDKFIIIDDNDEVFEIKTKSIIYFEINTDEVYIETKKFGVELAICKNNLMPIIDFFMPLVLN